MSKFRVFSGEVFEVEAQSAEEAEKKYWDSVWGRKCVCGVELCSCVSDPEVLTEVSSADADI